MPLCLTSPDPYSRGGTKLRSRVHILRKIRIKNCPYCLSSRVYASRPKRWWDRILFLFLLQLVRCHTCTHHHYRPIICTTARPPASAEVWRKEPQTISEGGYELAKTVSYAPNAGWLRAKSGKLADALANAPKLNDVAGMENVEPQTLSKAVRKR